MNKFDLVDQLVAKLGLSPKEMMAYWNEKEAKSFVPAKKHSVKKSKETAVPASVPRTASESDVIIDIPADDKIFLRIKKIIHEHTGAKEQDIKPETRIIYDLGADSLDAIEIVMEYEKEFGISIPDADSEKFVRIQDAWKYISEHVEL